MSEVATRKARESGVVAVTKEGAVLTMRVDRVGMFAGVRWRREEPEAPLAPRR